MLNYEEELKKFEPCLDVDEVEEAVYSRDLTDVFDLIREMEKNQRLSRYDEDDE
ncbi:MAG: hypothetical protein LKG40_03800 [Lachnospiraceae bacterium]|jgi:hypothetical protein|nr:hypothetical protein [Lachnospiraceae bacterium]MCI1327942.1 hypothetical protein [Lachnospiraceae bacterium]